MKKLSLSIATMMFAMMLFAQDAQNPQTAKQMTDLRKDIKDVRKDKVKRNMALRQGNKEEVKELNKGIKQDKQDIKDDAKNLKAEGVKHPIKRAERQIHRQHHK